MAFSLRHFIYDKAAAAISLVHGRISVFQIRGCSSKVVSSPWLMLQSARKKDGDNDAYEPALKERSGGDYFNFYSLAQEKVVSFKKPSDQSPQDLLVGSSHGWLALHNRRGDGGLSLLNPITGENIKLPAMVGCRVEKVILTCGDPHDEECRALASLNGSVLAFCSPGRSSQWTTRITGSLPYADLAYSTAEGLFLTIRNTQIGEELEGWDATDPSSPRIRLLDDFYGYRYPLGRPGTPWHCNTGSYLVYAPPDNKLILVRRYVCDKYHNTYAFDVYAVDRERRELELMDKQDSSSGSLDGMALFVGPSHSMAVLAEAAQVKGGCIYYTGSLLAVTWPFGYLDDRYMYGGNDIGVFDCYCKNSTIYNCYYKHDQYWDTHLIWPPPLWFTPSPSPSPSPYSY